MMLPMTQTSSTLPPELPANALPQAYVARLFERLGAQLGAKLADLYAGSPPALVQYEWASALAGFSKHELKRGIEACQSRRFAPTVGEFAQLCRPSLDPEIAWHEATSGLLARESGEVGVWSHPAVYWAAMAMYAEVRAGNLRACRNRWEVNLRQSFAQKVQRDIPDVPLRIDNAATRARMSPAFRLKLQSLGFRVGKSS